MMNTPATHDPSRTGGRPAPGLRPPPLPHSLLGTGIMARLGLAALATGLLWLAVLWALD
ncbi:hypothetical protein [Thauera linaloolentis]|uniref:hypothetical protein n=1 Tax=Thauera linaloolentis TaxID=76112 RepID=UPI000AA33541|nr:hypothetical protein [Thauera linaloolentis]MCM8565634.1 hypothetical protein [Thauera linaloolentis]